MLTIRRVPTVVSLQQEDADPKGCGKDCLGACCIAGSSMPLYNFARRYVIKPKRIRSFGDLSSVPDSFGSSDSSSDSDEMSKSFFDSLLTAQWEDRMERGLFRYDVTACATKEIDGEYGFIAQLNEGRHLKKRATEFRIDQVLQDFDPKKFNFTKVAQDEVLFRFEESLDGKSHYMNEAPLTDSPNVVVINVSPIEYGHVLLVPRVLDHLPQRIQFDTLLLALHMAVEADNPYLRLGYNSLGAFATINQLHFQAYYLQAPFPIERAPTVRIGCKKRSRRVKISSLAQYPVRALVYEVSNSLEEVAMAVTSACQELERRNIPFNLLISDRGARVFLMPQCFAEKQARNEVPLEILECQVNPAAWEISGHIVLKRKEDYEAVTQESVWELLSQVSLSREAFAEVKQICLEEVDKALEEKLPALLESYFHSAAIVRSAPGDAAVVMMDEGESEKVKEKPQCADQEVPVMK